jgi:polar amino acid transport system substrate-binding protein
MKGHTTVSLHKKSVAVTLASIVALGLSACGPVVDNAASNSSESGAASSELTALPEVRPVAELAARVPQELRDSGFTVVTNPHSPPMTYVAEDGKTLVGFDLDMARAIGKVLDVKLETTEAGLDTIIPGLAANRYTMALATIGVTPERQKSIDFVSYYKGGQGFLATKKTDFEITELEDLCGHRVAVSVGSVQQTALADSAGICKAAGLEDYTVQPYPNNNQSVLAISSERADVMYASISIVGYSAKQNPDVRVAGVYKRTTVAAALPKNSALTPVVHAAVQHLMDDGTYTKILKKWGLEDNAIPSAEINPAK